MKRLHRLPPHTIELCWKGEVAEEGDEMDSDPRWNSAALTTLSPAASCQLLGAPSRRNSDMLCYLQMRSSDCQPPCLEKADLQLVASGWKIDGVWWRWWWEAVKPENIPICFWSQAHLTINKLLHSAGLLIPVPDLKLFAGLYLLFSQAAGSGQSTRSAGFDVCDPHACTHFFFFLCD